MAKQRYRLYLNDGKEFIQEFSDDEKMGTHLHQVRALYQFCMIHDYDKEPDTVALGFYQVPTPDSEQPA